MKQLLLYSLPLTLMLAATASAEPHAAVLEAERQRIETIRKASEAFVAVFADAGQGGGSGVVISPDGYALSNFHVTQPAGNHMKCGMPDGKLYDAVIVSVDPTGDVALIKLLGRDDFPHATLGDSDQVRVGDWCFAVGNPFLLANDFQPTVSYGVVSGVNRYQYPAGTLLEYADCIQTDAAINPGNSGGPLFNAQGELIGINGRGSFEKRGRVNVGVGYAISINQIKNFMGYLMSGRIVDHATLGATVSTDADGQVVVDNILEDSDAYRRGLRYDDEIVRFGNREIHTVNAFKNVLGIYPRDWRVPLTYRRDGQTYDTLVRLAGVHHESELEAAVQGKQAPELPKPGDKPEGDKSEEDGQPKLPEGHPLLKKAAPMPKIAADQFEKRRGYANYYFNRQNQARVWNAFVARGDFSGVEKDWTMVGTLAGGGDVTVRLTAEQGVVTLPVGESKALFTEDLAAHLNPPGSGGLLVTLHLWQRLLTEGPQKFGEVSYWGTMPIPTQPGLVDVLVGLHGGMEVRFFFEPSSGYLVGLEMFPADDLDPCEIYFSDYRETAGRWLPYRWEVRHGDGTFAVLELKTFKLEKPAEN